ncbi:secretin N-terminal domain-containing protein [Kosakonia oryzendophytica]|uniref:secretin N-terminal domain-containing protein n=1 Tax=Kosakonia oryzendophytica TaxID=1005665 RepID=UPI0022EC7F8E|nr:secretin N-terminal domain-containing protein [Kosakonia oryzendophytica]WBT56075.1 general secretion pathway protein GspD [Kosakonia oryzendophytica]
MNNQIRDFKLFISLCLAMLLIIAFNVSAEPVSLNNTPVRAFVQWYSQKANKSVVVNPDVKGNITVFNADVNQANIDDFFKSVLNSNGFVLSAGNPAVVTTPTKLPSQIDNNDDYEDPAAYDPVSSAPATAEQTPAVPVDLTVRNFKLTRVRSSDVMPLVKIFIDSNGGGNVVDYSGNNSLVVSASASIMGAMTDFVHSIDVARDQVLIQSLMFETTLTNGIDLSFAAGSASGGKVAGGFNTSSLRSALSTAGGSFGIFNGNILALSLQAVKNDSSSRVLSTPRILTQSGQTGFISVGQNVPFVTGKVTGEAANVNNPFQTIERRDVGVSLKVTPVVMGNGQLALTIDTGQIRSATIPQPATSSRISVRYKLPFR